MQDEPNAQTPHAGEVATHSRKPTDSVRAALEAAATSLLASPIDRMVRGARGEGPALLCGITKHLAALTGGNTSPEPADDLAEPQDPQPNVH